MEAGSTAHRLVWYDALVTGQAPGTRARAEWRAFAAFAAVMIVGMAAWFVTAIEQAAWAFNIDGVSDVIATFGIGPVDVREPVIANGLA